MPERRSADPRRKNTDRRTGDRRDTPRLDSSVNIRFLRSGADAQAILQGELLDASRTGVQLILDERVAESETLLIELWGDMESCFNLTAEVIWLEPVEHNRYRVGCELRVDLSPRQFKLLRQCIQIDSAQPCKTE